jgi:hypothetical protein
MSDIEWSDENIARHNVREQIRQQKELSNGLIGALIGGCLASLSLVVWIAESVFDSVLLGTGGLLADVLPHLVATLLIIPIFVILRTVSIRIQYPELWNKGMCPLDRGWLRPEWMEFGVFITALPGILNNVGAFAVALGLFIILNILLPVRDEAVILSLGLSMIVLLWLSFGPAPQIGIPKNTFKTAKDIVKDPITGPLVGAVIGQIANVVFDKSIRRSGLVDQWLPEKDDIIPVMFSTGLGVLIYVVIREGIQMI